MDHFVYKNGELYAEDVPVSAIAKKFGTPFYCYSHSTLTHHFKVFAEGFKNRDVLICFAVKSNSNLAVIKTLAQAGAGADVVSEGEIRRALKAGVDPQKIIFSGVGKTAEEMKFALEQNIFQFNVESEAELELLSETANKLGKTANIAIRVNPDIDAGTNSKITTGLKTSKFGVDINVAPELYQKAAKLPSIKVQAISVHIGSQITDFEPFKKAFIRVREFWQNLEKSGIKIARLDLGGGIGVPYEQSNTPPPHPREYAEIVLDIMKDFPGKLIFEPGRVLVGNAGIMVSEVIYTKPTDERNFLIVDAAMNDLIRPSFYSAHHDIIPVKESKTNNVKYDIVGPVCETGDTFATLRELPELKSGDLVAFRTAGAYGAVMASTYNSRRILPEIMVKGSEFSEISSRQTYEQMFEREIMPKWLEK